MLRKLSVACVGGTGAWAHAVMRLFDIRIAKKFSLSGYGFPPVGVKPAAASLQICALSDSQGTLARSAEISRLACCSMDRRSRTRRVRVVRREWLEELSDATTRCW